MSEKSGKYRAVEMGELIRRGFSKRFIQSSLKDYQGSEDVRRKIKNYVNKFEKFEEKGVGLLLIGSSFCGKSLLAAVVAKCVFARFKEVLVTDLDKITSLFFNIEDEELEDDEREQADFSLTDYRSTDFLVIDSIERLNAVKNEQYKVNDGMRTAFSSLIRYRDRANKPTLITTSLQLEGEDAEEDSIERLFGANLIRVLKSRYVIIECPDVPGYVEKQTAWIEKEINSDE